MPPADLLKWKKNRTQEEIREYCAKGGRNSGKRRVELKTMRETMIEMLSLMVKHPELIPTLQAYGFDGKSGKLTGEQAIAIGQIVGASSGSAQCYRNILDVLEPKEAKGEEEMYQKLDEVLDSIKESAK